MKDIIGQVISVGDDVIHTGGYYANGKIAKVVKVCDKKVTISRVWGTQGQRRKYGVFPDTIVVVTKLLPVNG